MRIGLKDSEQINCEKVWDAFKETFAFKGPCDVTTKDYLVFLEKIEEDIPKNKVTMKLYIPFTVLDNTYTYTMLLPRELIF